MTPIACQGIWGKKFERFKRPLTPRPFEGNASIDPAPPRRQTLACANITICPDALTITPSSKSQGKNCPNFFLDLPCYRVGGLVRFMHDEKRKGVPLMTMTTAEIAQECATTPKTLRKFLRADSKIESVGKGSRYSIDRKDLRGLKTRFEKWNAAQIAARNAKLENTDSE